MDKVMSVSIAAYNVASTLEQALDPFISDRILPYVDVMIVDDGSKDNTAEIAKKYVSRYPESFRLISKENGGWGSTLNTGMREAIGKYFKELDGDDYFLKENLADFLVFLRETDADYIHTPFVEFEDESGAIIKELGGYSGTYGHFPQNQTFPVSGCDNYIPAMHCITVKTEILRKYNIEITEHCFYTDLEFAIKVYNSCDTMCFYKKPIYYYRLARSGQSMSLAGARKHYRDHIKMLKKVLAYTENHVREPGKKRNIDQRVLEACEFQYYFFFALDCSKREKQELKEYDAFLKKEYPVVYGNIHGRQINVLRSTDFNGYKLLAWQKMNKDKRLKRNFFEG